MTCVTQQILYLTSVSTTGVRITVHRRHLLRKPHQKVRRWKNMPPIWCLLRWSGKRNSTRTRKRR